MQIKLQNHKGFEAFINVAGNTQDTSTAQHNKAVNAFIELFNSGKVTIEAFTGADGKIVMGFK